MNEEKKCPNCGEWCSRDSADVGVGVIYGPWGCPCGWSEDERYNQLTGPKRTHLGGVIDQYGGITPNPRIFDETTEFNRAYKKATEQGFENVKELARIIWFGRASLDPTALKDPDL